MYSNTRPVWDHGPLHRAEEKEKQATKKEKEKQPSSCTGWVCARSLVGPRTLIDRLLMAGEITRLDYARKVKPTDWLAWLVVLTEVGGDFGDAPA